MSHPPVATERMALTSSGHVRYPLKTPYRDGTTHVVIEPLDFMARLAALVPPPRMHLTRYHGVFAPHSKLRAAVTPAHRGMGAPQSLPAAEACVWHRDPGLCPLRREAPGHRQHRGAAGDREDPRAPGAVAGPPALSSKKRGAWGLSGEPVGQGRCVPGSRWAAGEGGLRRWQAGAGRGFRGTMAFGCLPGRPTGPTMTLFMPPQSPQPISRASTGLADGV